MRSSIRTPRRRACLPMWFALASLVAVATACSPRSTAEQDPSRDADARAAEDTAAGGAAALPFVWPAPPGWRSETIPFPLDFAPGIPYAGLEELRFAPGMFKPESEDFWTYAFVWWIEGDVRFDASTLNDHLIEYYEGLSAAVEDSARFDPKEARVDSKIALLDSEGPAQLWHGTLSTYEPFATHARITLKVEVEALPCNEQGHTAGIFLVSPQPRGHAVWRQLDELKTAFRCSRP